MLIEEEPEIPEEDRSLQEEKIEFKQVNFGDWKEFKKALTDFKLSQLVYEKITGEMIS